MKQLKTKVFYKLFLNTVHRNGDLKQKPYKKTSYGVPNQIHE